MSHLDNLERTFYILAAVVATLASTWLSSSTSPSQHGSSKYILVVVVAALAITVVNIVYVAVTTRPKYVATCGQLDIICQLVWISLS